jgi:hypothetical protein
VPVLWTGSNNNNNKDDDNNKKKERLFIDPNETEEKKEESGRRARKAQEKRQEYARRRALWAEKYGSLEALKKRFGSGPPWGDLSPPQTRTLYHTLLPRSLLGLYELEVMKPEELAPLAYEARVAAKQYARSRCILPGR